MTRLLSLAAVLVLLLMAIVHAQVLAPLDFYVATTGNNTNNNCQNVVSPCATMTYAVAQSRFNYVPPGIAVNIHQAAGDYTESVWVNGISNINFIGAGSSVTSWNGEPGSHGTLIGSYFADVSVAGVTMKATGDPIQSALYVQLGAVVETMDDVVFGPATTCHLFAEDAGSDIQIWRGYTVTDVAYCHAVATSLSAIGWNGGQVTLNSGTTPYSGYFFWAEDGGLLYFNATPINGIVYGTRVYVGMNGVVKYHPGGCDAIPGSGAIKIISGGRCG